MSTPSAVFHLFTTSILFTFREAQSPLENTMEATLYKFCDTAASGKQQVKDAAFQVRTTSTILEEIGKVFEDEGQVSKPLFSRNAITTANEIVERCSLIFETLREMFKDAESTVGLLKFGLQNSRLRVFRVELSEMKSNLQCIMQVVIYARMKAEQRAALKGSEQLRLIKDLISQQLNFWERYRQTNPTNSSPDDAVKAPLALANLEILRHHNHNDHKALPQVTLDLSATTTPKINSKLNPQTQNSLTASPYTTYNRYEPPRRPSGTIAELLGDFPDRSDTGSQKGQEIQDKKELAYGGEQAHWEVNKLIGSLSLGLMRTARLKKMAKS
ncbi:uncharacterized protein ASPGLDRAFT_36565 [Aspergillus glaucus CBS 516.65]|uniref:Fungal N-terminal domain-containing protein n=1 Tax=Aspergillus glaucus CBS 516.65 TaxID=1160497 RepID=A0A1L9VGR6_ASPGL|nr:hypothetical protein ASPGLDRAFT_36565 [Aspergillus glaucus CBS 516.65]OJJ83104.1 hypothetical protein ASPGLDRAFT_36565 [Aspergillus glaucus CBS 516.65]